MAHLTAYEGLTRSECAVVSVSVNGWPIDRVQAASDMVYATQLLFEALDGSASTDEVITLIKHCPRNLLTSGPVLCRSFCSYTKGSCPSFWGTAYLTWRPLDILHECNRKACYGVQKTEIKGLGQSSSE